LHKAEVLLMQLHSCKCSAAVMSLRFKTCKISVRQGTDSPDLIPLFVPVLAVSNYLNAFTGLQ